MRDFCYERGLMGDGKSIADKDEFGISFPNGTVLGNKKHVVFRFDASYMQKAADGKLN
jgi:NitT/TauT family transport system substrate-binding protein